MTRIDAETALDAGKLFIRMSNGNLWSARRNGATKTWKTREGDFRIPIKYGFKSYGAIDHNNITCGDLVVK